MVSLKELYNTILTVYNSIKKAPNLFLWRHLEDTNLYLDNDYALTKIQEIHAKESKTPFHAYWYGDIGRKQAFSMKSFLCTQNLEKVELNLWLDVDNGFTDFINNIYLKPLLPFINIKSYSVHDQANDFFAKKQIDEIVGNDDLVHKADAFRFIILAKFGGVYFDLDMMFLKNFEPLLGDEFCYAWEFEPYANSAILSLAKNGKLANYLLEKTKHSEIYHPTFTFRYSDKKLSSLLVYPCTFFDPIWMPFNSLLNQIPFSTFDGFFKEFNESYIKIDHINSYKHFFPGCYTYHWHNQWNSNEYENSYFGIFDKEFEEILNSRFNMTSLVYSLNKLNIKF